MNSLTKYKYIQVTSLQVLCIPFLVVVELSFYPGSPVVEVILESSQLFNAAFVGEMHLIEGCFVLLENVFNA